MFSLCSVAFYPEGIKNIQTLAGTQRINTGSTKIRKGGAVPKHIVFIDTLPKTPNGKIDKKQLKNME